MNNRTRSNWACAFFLSLSLPLLHSCTPSVQLTGSWNDNSNQHARFSKIMVLAIGNDLGKRKLGEDHIKAELQKHGFSAAASLDEFGPGFVNRYDSTKMRQLLLDRQFDAVVTVRVLNIDEHDRWMPGSVYYGPIGYYRGFYGYYYRAWGYYGEPGYPVTDVEVLLESNLYEVATARLLWSGQSRTFSKNPTPAMATHYAKNIVEDMTRKGVLSRNSFGSF